MDLSYQKYVQDAGFHDQYVAYQSRYRENMRESDRALLGHIARTLPATSAARQRLRLLDVGCSTGNLLLHLRRAFPDLTLAGADLMQRAIDQCRQTPELVGIEFGARDMLDLKADGEFDRVVANAVTYLFTPEEFGRSMRSVAKALRPGGYFFGFEWMHPYRQELQIVEYSRGQPQGLKMHARSYTAVRAVLEESGFDDVQFHAFQIPIDLAGSPAAGSTEAFEDLNTRTIRTDQGERLMFRGALAQPWCHLVARKMSG